MNAITIYTTPTCVFCHAAKKYFSDKGYEFTEKDISIDKEALKFVLEKVGQAVSPIITIGDKVIVGFDREAIDTALEATPDAQQKAA